MTDVPFDAGARASPRLSRDEWVLLLDLYMRRRPHGVTAGDPELEELSRLLGTALSGSAVERARWRTPDGLRARTSVFRVLDPDVDTIDTKRATIGRDVWQAYAHDPGALAREVVDARARVAARTMRDSSTNPIWTEEETLLGLDAYLQVRPRYASKADPAIQQLSKLLRIAAARNGLQSSETFRNTVGVARKVNKFRAAEAGRPPSTVKGANLEQAIWKRYLLHPGETLVRIADLKREVLATAEPVAQGGIQPSRGPSPAFGPTSFTRTDGETLVYCLQLTGPVAALYPALVLEGFSIIKVGRTNDPIRRLAELNAGFPPGCGLAWTSIGARTFPSAQQAHAEEQRLLDRLFARGRTLGGEFGCARTDELTEILRLEPVRQTSGNRPTPDLSEVS